MITFDSPAGAALRKMTPSRRALAALWFTALTEDHPAWAEWAKSQIATHPNDPVVVALNLLQAANDGDLNRAKQLWTVLSSFPTKPTTCPITRAARDVGGALG